jgi:hypothetical protein
MPFLFVGNALLSSCRYVFDGYWIISLAGAAHKGPINGVFARSGVLVRTPLPAQRLVSLDFDYCISMPRYIVASSTAIHQFILAIDSSVPHTLEDYCRGVALGNQELRPRGRTVEGCYCDGRDVPREKISNLQRKNIQSVRNNCPRVQ